MAELTYKKGDVVVLINKRPWYWNVDGKMDKFLGKTVTLTGIKHGNIKFDGIGDWAILVEDIARLASAQFVPYALPLQLKDVKEALKPTPKSVWTPEVGKLVHTFRPFRIYKDHKNGWFEICDDNGNCLTASSTELKKHFYETLNTDYIMKAMKEACLLVAKQLAKANNTVTTLEVKQELRRDYPYYFWTQDTVSSYMSQFAGDGIFTYSDNGTFRTYSLVSTAQAAATAGPVSKSLNSAKTITKQVTGATGYSGTTGVTKPTGTRRRGRPRKTTSNVTTRMNVYSLVKDSGFQSLVVAGQTVNRADIRAQKKSPHGYLTPTKLAKVTAVTVSGTTYQVQ